MEASEIRDRSRLVCEVRPALKQALDHHIDGVVLDLGIHAAHNAGQRHGALAVGDETHAGVERALLAVERRELLILLGGADHHTTAAIALGKGVQVSSAAADR